MAQRTSFAAWKLAPPVEEAHLLDPEYLKTYASWIRDDLDPIIAREGPSVLDADNVVTLFKFFEQLRTSQLTLEFVRESRIHLALLEISGCATRWPAKVIDEAEEICRSWECLWGPLRSIRPNLYGPRGRLYGISTPEDIQKDVLFVKWSRMEIPRAHPNYARRTGDLGFRPGDWWINPTYAFYDGIIDHSENKSKITSCSQQAYALLLTRDDETESIDPARFTYHARPEDTSRYRLVAGTLSSRQPVRVLRSHNLRSFWAPRAGVRYDGLYKVSGWCITKDTKTNAIQYHISFTRLPSESPLAPVLNRPTAAELDDYLEYKRVRHEIRSHRNLLRHGLQFGPTDEVSEERLDSMDTTATVKRSLTPTKRDSLPPQPPVIQPSSGPDDNPFFSGALDMQTGMGKINVLRPDVINYAPVLNAASAAGASIDPFFAGALEEQAAKRAAAMRPMVPLNLMKAKTDEHRRSSVVEFAETAASPSTDKTKASHLNRRRSVSFKECPLRRRSRA